MDDLWKHVILAAFAWSMLAIILLLIQVMVRKWLERRSK